MNRSKGAIAERPMEFLIGLLCVQAGVGMVLLDVSPRSISDLMPTYMVKTWGATLAVGGILVVIGIAIRYANRLFVLGLLIEKSGYWPLASGSFVFSVAITLQAGLDGLFPALTYATFAIMCVIRHADISSLIKRLKVMAKEDD